ncbi:hypothetical protein LTR35_018202 [Friedmanniomyces endolithicus]|uniref:Nucleoside phosphorylase domain-containing protein n=1 Tax=Friedmanniomyces endolithicus TaxID=329885 RepID=A0AAN6IZN2_9PEZI|nr:hypothetical protein LTR35_018202 [Friedmanniomyces endolithicus]KAK0262750.1 hypothetical protein LTS00_018097 [Friedmanniomyces endolithicus]KAK0301943.1 hypothetical protein LTR82_018056 [Friedmanniomyces endolithicus]KAK0967448.1 hypothetical protein LTR54_018273 [Friedmanniomyces endolithicus]
MSPCHDSVQMGSGVMPVWARLPAGVTGKVSAATVAEDMIRSFPIKAGFMVGIGGGVWSEQADVRLGNVVVSQPDGMHGGVVQWDFDDGEEGGVPADGDAKQAAATTADCGALSKPTLQAPVWIQKPFSTTSQL